MIVRRLAVPLFLAVALSTPAIAEDDREDKWSLYDDRFALWTECRPVKVWVYTQFPEATNLNLTESRIETAVRARLRSARIFTDDISIPPKRRDVYDHQKQNLDKLSETERQEFLIARIKLIGETPFLSVSVHVVGNAFSVSVALRKELRDSLSGSSNRANSWETTFIGTITNNSIGGDYILSTISEAVDQFIDEYLRVNELDC